jgi:hypothetical protein
MCGRRMVDPIPKSLGGTGCSPIPSSPSLSGFNRGTKRYPSSPQPLLLIDLSASSRSKPPSSRRSSQLPAWPCWQRVLRHGTVGGWSCVRRPQKKKKKKGSTTVSHHPTNGNQNRTITSYSPSMMFRQPMVPTKALAAERAIPDYPHRRLRTRYGRRGRFGSWESLCRSTGRRGGPRLGRCGGRSESWRRNDDLGGATTFRCPGGRNG